MRYVLTGRQPVPSSILLVESGSREPLEKLVPLFRSAWGEHVRIDVLGCYGALPRGLEPETSRLFRAGDYPNNERRRQLYRELKQANYSYVGILCSEEPILTKWKWALAVALPAKVFIINENGDFFWLDWQHRKVIRQFVVVRSGLAGTGAVRMLARAFCFPFGVAYLILYAAAAHSRRALRMLASRKARRIEST